MLFNSTTTLKCVDKQTYTANGCGVVMGSSRAPKDFNHVLRPKMLEYNLKCESLPTGKTSNLYDKLADTPGTLAFAKFQKPRYVLEGLNTGNDLRLLSISSGVSVLVGPIERLLRMVSLVDSEAYLAQWFSG